LSSVRVRYLDRDAVLAKLRVLAAEIGAARPEVSEIRLFGSLARGERNPFADADLLIVLDSSDVPYRDRSPLYKPAGSPVPMDLTVCTRAELDREMAAGNRFIRRIAAESVALYARNEPAGATSEPAPGT
jgi:predicted nucleotidyltransferase